MLKQIKNFLIMTLSITIMAIGVYYFKFPNNFTFGGVTGAAVVFAKEEKAHYKQKHVHNSRKHTR